MSVCLSLLQERITLQERARVQTGLGRVQEKKRMKKIRFEQQGVGQFTCWIEKGGKDTGDVAEREEWPMDWTRGKFAGNDEVSWKQRGRKGNKGRRERERERDQSIESEQ